MASIAAAATPDHSLDARAKRTDYIVGVSAFERRPIVGGDGFRAARAQAYHLVARRDVRDMRDIDCGVIHGNAPDHRASDTLDEHLPAICERQRQTVCVACGDCRNFRLLAETPRASISESRARAERANLRDTSLERQHRFDCEGAAAIRIERSMEIDAGTHHVERSLRAFREIVYGVGCRHVNLPEIETLLSRGGDEGLEPRNLILGKPIFPRLKRKKEN